MSATEGKRLLAFLHQHVPRAEGGLDAFALRHGLRRQTPYEWAAGKSKPNLGTLKPWADALGVTRAEMVAAMDAVPAPELEIAAVPEWAQRLLTGVMALETKQGVTAEELDEAHAAAVGWVATEEQRGPRRPTGGGAGGGTSA